MNQKKNIINLIALALTVSVPVGNVPAQTNTRPNNALIRGTVTDEKKSPLAAVRIQVMGLEELREGKWTRELRLGVMAVYLSDKNGRFEIPQREPDVRFDLCFDKNGFAPVFLSGISSNSPSLSVVLERGMTVVGQVTRPAGSRPQPIVGAKVELELPGPDFWYRAEAVTDSKGKYSFQVTEPPAGRRWQINFGGQRVPFVVRKGEPVTGPDFSMESRNKASVGESFPLLSYRDPDSGIVFYVESDRHQVMALAKEGKVLWCRQPALDGNLPSYSETHPTWNPSIVWIGGLTEKENERLKKTGSGKFIGISFGSRQAGVMDMKNGDFTFEGQD